MHKKKPLWSNSFQERFRKGAKYVTNMDPENGSCEDMASRLVIATTPDALARLATAVKPPI